MRWMIIVTLGVLLGTFWHTLLMLRGIMKRREIGDNARIIVEKLTPYDIVNSYAGNFTSLVTMTIFRRHWSSRMDKKVKEHLLRCVKNWPYFSGDIEQPVRVTSDRAADTVRAEELLDYLKRAV